VQQPLLYVQIELQAILRSALGLDALCGKLMHHFLGGSRSDFHTIS